MIDPRVRSLCSEFGLEIVPKHIYPLPGQTRAVVTISRIIDRRGIEHTRLVMTVFAECQGNQGLADEVSLWTISDLILAMSDVIEGGASAFLEAMDKIPLGPLMMFASELRGHVHQRAALAGMLYLHLRHLGRPGAPSVTKVRRARHSEDVKRAA